MSSPGSLGLDPQMRTKPLARKGPGSLKKSDVNEPKVCKPNSCSPSEDVAGKTLGQVLKELDLERGQRQETEQLCRDLTQRVFRLEASAVDETKALEATNQLKQAFTAERRARLDAEARLRELDVGYELCVVSFLLFAFTLVISFCYVNLVCFLVKICWNFSQLTVLCC
ncbi:hypothetical protein P879_05536 [Paragonimus westermani]|uniref:Uncharacterized protein n=1 Tax=Paragonimus westermani TaxID=34504 RepID=A0A8T0DVD8_9TREM|nr:hypothetical protein P879_05536 [Paragonimus westermani]